MNIYESLRKLTKAMIFHSIFLEKSLTFVPFHSFAMFFVIFHYRY